MAEYRAAVTGRQGPKGDPGDAGGGGRTAQTITFNNASISAGWRSAEVIIPNMAAGQTVPAKFRLLAGSPVNGGSAITMYIQAFRSSDGALIQNLGPVTFTAPYSTSAEPAQAIGLIDSTFTNNTGVAQDISFVAHVSAGSCVSKSSGSYLSV